MYNKVFVENPKRKWLKLALLYLTLISVLVIVVLFVFRTVNTRNYNGQVFEVRGILTDVNYDGEDGIEIKLDNGQVYNANPIANFDENLHLNMLLDEKVTLVIPQRQLGSGLPWVIGLKQGDTVIVDYKELCAQNIEDNKTVMIIIGVVAGVLALATGGVFVWRTRVAPTKERALFKEYCDINIQRQPTCQDMKKLGIYVLTYIVYTLIYCVIVGVVGSLEENGRVSTATCIVVCVLLGIVFVAYTVGMFVLLAWIIKRERKFYADNFPFDFTDLSHVAIRKQIKEKLQKELKAERAKFPHRYGDGGNGFTVEFCDMGLKIYYFDPQQQNYEAIYPSAGEIFDVQDSEHNDKNIACILSYSELNFEALPHYRKRYRPLAVVVKSRLEKTPVLPREMVNDIHLLLDSNLLATLRHFNVPVENLDYILDNKEQLINENCPKAKIK